MESPLIQPDMSLTPEAVYEISSRLLRRYSTLHDRVRNRRKHYNNDSSVDPKLGEYLENGRPAPNNPFLDVPAYQADTPRRVAQQVVARLVDNPALFYMDARRSREKTQAIEAALIFNEWKSEIQERTGIDWQQAASNYQVRDCYAVIHTYRLDHLRPPIEKYKVKSLEGVANPKDFEEDFESETGYIERDEIFRERRDSEYAEMGAPWQVEFPSPLFFAGERDRIGPGFRCCVLAYEVDALDYALALGENEYGPTPLSNNRPAPGLEQARGQNGEETFESPSAQDYEHRRRIWQFWTRTEYYELAEEDPPQKGRRKAKMMNASRGAPGMKLVKAFRHEYPGVPFEIIWANRTYDEDPAWEAEPYMEGVYRFKPYWDFMMSRTAAIMDKTAIPPMIEVDAPGAPSPVTETGDIPDEDSESALGGRLPPGRTLKQVQIQATAGISQILQLLTALMKEAEPPSGSVEIGASTAPWTARIWQTQANIGPSILVANQAKGFRWLAEFWRKWHVAHPDEPFLAYAHPSISKDEIIKVDPKALAGMKAECAIAPYSKAEQLTIAEHLASFVERGLQKRQTLYKDGFGERDPHQFELELDAENIVRPYKQKLADTMFASRMAAMFTMNSKGQIADATGTMIEDPRDVLRRTGWDVKGPAQSEPEPEMQMQPDMPMQPQPQQQGTRPRSSAATMPMRIGELQQLETPGTLSIRGPQG